MKQNRPSFLRQSLRYTRLQLRRLFGLNISQIDDQFFVGGQFRPEQWPAMAALGVGAVLSLQDEHEDRFVGTPPLAHRIRVLDFTAPSLEQLREGVEFIDRALGEQRRVFIHCHAGVGRAPTMAAAYLVARSKMSANEALGYLRAARPIIALNRGQRQRLGEWEALVRRAQEP